LTGGVTLYAVTAVGLDQPGVVAALSGVLVGKGCNLEETQMAVLRGYATMMLVVRAPGEVTAEDLRSALALATERFGLSVSVLAIEEVPATDAPGSRWSVSLWGSDRPGIVFEVTRLLARASINIVDLHTRLRDRVSTLAMEVLVPPGTDGDLVAAELDRLAGHLGVACSMHPAPPHGGRP
jgi:glycine cleavage system transcriptional repressor